jgi:hypothetical protein
MRTNSVMASVIVGMLLMGGAAKPTLNAEQEDRDRDRGDRIQHVLLLSIDGMHALDFENCAKDGTCPHLAALGDTGVNYTRTSASRPSDSFPGLMALVTGGTPRTVGAYYDVAYDRVLAPPMIDTRLFDCEDCARETRCARRPESTVRFTQHDRYADRPRAPAHRPVSGSIAILGRVSVRTPGARTMLFPAGDEDEAGRR